jgi:hypothetical protein
MNVEPRQHSSDKAQTFASQGDGIRDVVFNANLLEEEATAVAECSTVGDMGHERHACDLGATKIGSAKGVPVRGAGTLFFLEFVSMNHQGNGIIIVDVVLGIGETLE